VPPSAAVLRTPGSLTCENAATCESAASGARAHAASVTAAATRPPLALCIRIGLSSLIDCKQARQQTSGAVYAPRPALSRCRLLKTRAGGAQKGAKNPANQAFFARAARGTLSHKFIEPVANCIIRWQRVCKLRSTAGSSAEAAGARTLTI